MEEKLMKRRGSFFFMLVLNIALACAILVFFEGVVKTRDQKLLADAIENKMATTSTLAGQFCGYLLSMDQVGENYPTYIQEESLTLEETINYLGHWKSFYPELAIIDATDYSAVSFFQDRKEPVKTDFSDQEWARALCDDFDRLGKDKSRTCLTEPFYSEVTGTDMVGFYKPVVIENRKYVLLFESYLTDLQKSGMNVQGLDMEQGMLIDGNGRILLGEMPIVSGEETNYFDALDLYFGEETENETRQRFAAETDGQFVAKATDGRNWICMFHSLPVTNGWRYLYYEDYDALEKSFESGTLAFWVVVFMGAWLLLDIVVYFWYNNKLRKSLKIIAKQNEDLQVANRAKTSFVSNMSHEIRTPINAVLGMNEMIIRETEDEKIRSYAYDIRDAGRILLGIINNVLDFSKIESGKMEIVPGEYETALLVHDVCSVIELKARSKGLKLELQVDENLPARLYGDEVRIRQILINLLTNAVKYTDTGIVTLCLEGQKTEADQMILQVAVKDTGIGIKQEEMDKLSVEFVRLGEKRNHTVEGTGLGLPIVMRLLAMMDSRLEVESVYGLGSVFSFSLKQKIVDSTPIGDIRKLRDRMLEEDRKQKDHFTARGAKILVVDDTAVNLKVVCGFLKNSGIEVDTADSGERCLEMEAQKKYDLIFLDHRMPGMDGIETIHRIRRDSKNNRNTPIVALTANVVSGARDMYIREGFSDFLSKPISGESLGSMIRKYLSGKRFQEPEVDKMHGIEACGGEDVYREVVQAYVTQSPEVMEEIKKAFDTKDRENYQTHVHGVKSSSKYVGAIKLSEEAAKLELCAKEEQWEEIERNTEDFLNHYQRVVDQIRSDR